MDVVKIPISAVVEFYKFFGVILAAYILTPIFFLGFKSFEFSDKVVSMMKFAAYLVFAVLTFSLQVTDAGTLHFGMPTEVTLTQLLVATLALLEVASSITNFFKF